MRARRHYGSKSMIGSIAIRFAAFLALAALFVGLLNRPNGNWSSAVDITPHSCAECTPSR